MERRLREYSFRKWFRLDLRTKSGKAVQLVKLFVIVSLPLVALFVQNGFQYRSTKEAIDHMQATKDAVLLSRGLAKIMYRLAFERDATVLMLTTSASGHEAKKKVLKAQADTDHVFFSHEGWYRNAEAYGRQYESALTLLGYVHNKRDRRGVKVDDVIHSYTEVVDVLLKWTHELFSETQAVVWQDVVAFESALISMENLGLERATGSVLLAKGKHGYDYVKYLKYKNRGDGYFDSATDYNSHVAEMQRKFMSSMLYQNITDLRHKIVFMEGDDVFPHDDVTWFDHMTDYVTILYASADALGDHMIEMIKAPVERSKRGNVAVLVIGGIATVVIAAFLYMMISDFKRYSSTLLAMSEDLNDEKHWTEALVYQMLPGRIAKQLKAKRPVAPEGFESVTIYFSDVVGFTAIAALCAPLDVVNMLNNLYNAFDEKCDEFDVYKVETIGDAYMVVSGLPSRNDNKHYTEIADLAVSLQAAIKTVEVPHMPEENLKLRIGIHSGPVVAGVVGVKMPRYCLIGETVSTAHTMEQTGEAMKIHVSVATYRKLNRTKLYVFEHHGDVQLKGGDTIQAFWLVKRRFPVGVRIRRDEKLDTQEY